MYYALLREHMWVGNDSVVGWVEETVWINNVWIIFVT